MFRFNIRVYGIWVNHGGEVLVSDELIRGSRYTKFPGGGLEFGEGTRECLKREFNEELGVSVSIGEHIYTTDYFQLSAFNPDHQIISIYYQVHLLEPLTARISATPFSFDEAQMITYEKENETESFRMIHLDNLTESSVTLPIDKIVVGLLKKKQQ